MLERVGFQVVLAILKEMAVLLVRVILPTVLMPVLGVIVGLSALLEIPVSPSVFLLVLLIVCALWFWSLKRVQWLQKIEQDDRSHPGDRLLLQPEVRGLRWLDSDLIGGELALFLVNRSILDVTIDRYTVKLKCAGLDVWSHECVLDCPTIPAQRAHLFTVQFQWQPVAEALEYIENQTREGHDPINLGLIAEFRARVEMPAWPETERHEVRLDAACCTVQSPLRTRVASPTPS